MLKPDQVPLGNWTYFSNASFGSCHRTLRSQSGGVILYRAFPVAFKSQRQTIRSESTFSSEFIAAKICVEHIVALRFKLRMFGVPLDGPAKVLCDNESVVKN